MYALRQYDLFFPLFVFLCNFNVVAVNSGSLPAAGDEATDCSLPAMPLNSAESSCSVCCALQKPDPRIARPLFLVLETDNRRCCSQTSARSLENALGSYRTPNQHSLRTCCLHVPWGRHVTTCQLFAQGARCPKQ